MHWLPRPYGSMKIAIETRMIITAETPVDLLLQFAAAALPEQDVQVHECRITGELSPGFDAQDGIGERVWAHCAGEVEVAYRAVAEPRRLVPELAKMAMLPHAQLPGETVPYLFESRYCPSYRFVPFVSSRFGDTEGGARIVAITDWVARSIAYEGGVSTADTTAADTFLERRGVCRDFAHLVVAMARASDIPARFVSCYAPGVKPQDFHAVAEVFLADPATPGSGYWHMVDATGMAGPHDFVKIGVGRDAVDVSFLTSLGAITLAEKLVLVTAIA